MLAVSGRILTMLLTLLYVALSAGSCAVPPATDIAPIILSREEPPRRSLTILQSRGDISRSLQEAVDIYLERHPGISIRVQTIEDDAGYRATLRSRLASGEDVGLFHIFGYQDTLELLPHLDSLSDLDWAKEAVAGTLEPVTIDDAIYGIPYSLEGVGLLADPAIFAAAGINISDAASYEELEAAFRELREKITLGELREDFPELEAVTELPGQDQIFLGRLLMETALGGEFHSAAQAAASGSILLESEAAMGAYVDLLARYAAAGRGWQSLTKVTRALQIEGGLASGRVACIQQSTQTYSRVRALDADIASRLLLLPIPLGDEQPGYIYTGAPAYWAVNAAASDESKAVARDFLTWLYHSGAGGSVLSSGFGAVSPYRDFATETESPLDRQMLDYIEREEFLPRYGREFPKGWESFAAAALRRYFEEPGYAWKELCADLREGWAERARDR